MSHGRDLPPVGTEALDSRRIDERLARVTLGDIARTNRLFGGRGAVRFGVNRLLQREGRARALTVLDVGAGMGDVSQHLVTRMNCGDPRIVVVALDHLRVAARLCRRQGLTAVVGDTRALPFAKRSVDIVVVSQVLHHFVRKTAVDLIREFDRVARSGVVIADARPSRAASIGLWLVSFLLRYHPVTRRDGLVSIRRGFRRSELKQILMQAGVTADVYNRPWWRLVAVWSPCDAND